MQELIEQSVPTAPAGASLKAKAEDVFRGLWASLFYSGRADRKGLLICSADRSEGASTVACGLALAGSKPAGVARVALVDFNLRNPALDRMLGVKSVPGIAEIVADGSPPETAAQPVNAALDVYAAGNAEGRSLDILRSDALKSFFDVLLAGYDHVVVDAAAVNHFPDAQVLAGALKEVLLVAHTEQTPREAVAQAIKRLEAGGGKLAGLVLNMRTYPIPGFLYRRV